MADIEFVKFLLAESADVPVVVFPFVILAVIVITTPALRMAVAVSGHIPRVE